MNNLAMAYTMDGQAEKAEELLRQARQVGGDDPRFKQNLALVLGLQGKTAEAKSLNGEDESASLQPAAATEGMPSPIKAVASGPMTAPVMPVSSTPLDADEVIRAAMAAEALKAQPVRPASAKRKAAAPAALVSDAAPALRPSTR